MSGRQRQDGDRDAMDHDVERDFEDGEWVDGEFIYSKVKKGKVQSKEDAIYGIFNTTEDNAIDEDAIRARSRGKKAAAAAKPVQFVSGGSTQRTSDNGTVSSDPMNVDDNDDHDDTPARMGLGAGGGGGTGGGAGTGLGWSNGAGPSASSGGAMSGFNMGTGGLGFQASSGSQQSTRHDHVGFDNDTVSRTGLGSAPSSASAFPSAFGQHGGANKREREPDLADKYVSRSARQAKEDKKKAAKKKKKKKKGGDGTNDEVAEEIQAWNKHTKGIGLKLMQKFGYQLGEGLGANKQGIADIVHVKVRKAKQGITDGEQVNPDFSKIQREKKKQALQGTGQGSGSSGDDDEESSEDSQGEVGQGWKTGGGTDGSTNGTGSRRRRREYKVVSEIKAEIAAQPLSSQTVIDMRGPQSRVFTGMEQVTDVPTTSLQRRGVAPELLYNVRECISQAEIDLQRADRNIRRQRDTLHRLQEQQEQVVRARDRKARQVASLQTVISTISRIEDKLKDQTLASLQSMYDVFDDMQHRFPEEWQLFSLVDLIPALLFPRIRALTQRWTLSATDADSEALRLALQPWQALLHPTPATGVNLSHDNRSYWLKLVIDILLPKIRSHFTSRVNIREPAEFIDFLTRWSPLLTPIVTDNILTLVILPRLQREVEQWQPKNDPIAIHLWTHPWLPLIRHRIDTLSRTIRSKLGQALRHWQAADSSAFDLIAPWGPVWPGHDMANFLRQHILPKLADAWEQQHDPDTRLLTPLSYSQRWYPLMGDKMFADHLLTHFFPRWIDTLYQWLVTAPEISKVQTWYKQWRERLPKGVQEDGRVKQRLKAALDMMVKASSGQRLAQPPLMSDIAPAVPTASDLASTSAPTVRLDSWSFRDIIEQKAQENGLVFQPVGGKRHDGKQVFTFGALHIYLDKGVAFAKNGATGNWEPTSVAHLVLRNTAVQQ